MPLICQVLFLLLSLSVSLSGQQKTTYLPSSNIRIKTIVVDSTCLLVIDSLSILPSSIIITSNQRLENDAYFLDNNIIFVKPEFCSLWQGKLLSIQYRVFPFNLEQIITGIDSNLMVKKDIQIQNAYGSLFTPGPTSIIDTDGLAYRGSFGRGLSIGNNQSFVLNSNFDLQLQGDIGNGIKVMAAISDENLPIQAQGNTQQLQEFDRVFIQISKDKSSLIAGDYDLRNGSGYFMQYYKKLKGLSANTTYQINKNVSARTRSGFAVSRGKFARQTLQNQEGNQGPYKLAGNNNERFIIVLSGTEKVYFNGILLKRGFDLDYIIDYNRSEITFSPTRVVARDSRIIVEFEYTDVNYLRTLYELTNTFQGRNWQWNLNLYSEQDSKAQTANITLDSTDIRILETSGDDFTKMVRGSIRLADTSNQNLDAIRYKLIDHPTKPGEKILEFTTNLDSAIYTAVFTEVGLGRGDYEIDNTATVNGRVYRFVGPGIGKYSPVIQLIPPEQKQLLTTGGSWKITKKLSLDGEIAMSRFDVNTRSSFGNENNNGLAGMVGLTFQSPLDAAGDWKIYSNLSMEHVQAFFQPLNPFRNAEFSRDWNLSVLPARADENLMSALLSVKNKEGFTVDYGVKYFDRQSIYTGFKQIGKLDWTKNRITLTGNVSYLKANQELAGLESKFLRPNIQLKIYLDKSKNWLFQSEMDAENNIIRNQIDSLRLSGSAAYQHYKVYFGNNPDKKIHARMGVNRRYDQLPDADSMKQAAVADEWEFMGKWTSKSGNFINMHVTRRELQVLEPTLLTSAKNTTSLIGKIENQLVFAKKAIKTNWVYSISSGQEPKIEYKFIKLETGRGDFVYIGKDEIPNLSLVQDFRYNPSDPLANFIRITLYNNEFIRTNNLELNQSVRADLDKWFVSKSDFKKGKKRTYSFLSKFSVLSNTRIQKRILENSGGSFLSYVNFSVGDSNLVAYTGAINNTLYFNRGNVNYDIQIGQRKNNSRVVQINGFEDRGKEDVFLRSRIKISAFMDFILQVEQGINTYSSKIFSTRDYHIRFFNFFPEINWRPNQNSRMVFQYTYLDKKQTILGLETSFQHKLTLEFNWRKASLFLVDFQANYIRIQFDGESNSTIEYDMLEGLKDGNNFVWNLNFTRRVAKSIDLILNYEGRKPGNIPTIHVGQAQVKATF